MSELSSTQIPRPTDEQAFERCNEVLWRCILDDPTAKLHGRRGQRQHGVDILGVRAGDPNHIVGIQCKLKGEGKYLDEVEVREEVEKALAFRPLLSEFIIVTTAPTDVTLDRLAHELTTSASKGRAKNIKISVLGWNDLEREINRFPKARKAFDPSHTPYTETIEGKIEISADSVVSKIDTKLTSEFQSLHSTLTRLKATKVTTTSQSVESEQEKQINDCIELMNSDPHAAMGMLRNLENRLSDETPRRIRFRVAANIAACQLTLGNVDVAAQGFIDAWELTPEEPKAIANKAYGHLLKEDVSALRDFALNQMPRNPHNAGLAACYILGLMEDEKVTDPLIDLPREVVNTPEVSEAHIRWAMRRGTKGAWWELATSAYAEHPENDALADLYASALLDRILGGGPLQIGRFLDNREIEDVSAARDILTEKWQEVVDGSRYARSDQSILPLNLLIALRLLGEDQRAAEVANDALYHFPDDPTVKEYAAQLLAEQGATERASTLLSDLEPNRSNVGLRFTLACSAEDWNTVRNIVNNHLDVFPENEQEFVAAVGDRASAELASVRDRQSLLEKAYNQYQNNARAMSALSQGARTHGLDDLATACFQAALQAFQTNPDDFASRLSIAAEALSRGEFAITADLLLDQIPMDRDSAELQMLGQALVNDYPIRQRAIRFFEDLSSSVRDLLAFQVLLGALHYNRGASEEAIEPFARAFDHEPSTSSLMRLIRAHFSAGQKDAIEALLKAEDVDALAGSPQDRIDYSHVLLDFGEGVRAIELGYSALVDGINQVDVVRKFIGLILKPSSHRPDHSSDAIAPNTWVQLKSSAGETFEALIGEPESRRWGNNADLDNSFVVRILGLSTGDKLTQTNAITGLSEHWTVVAIKPNWVQAFHHLLGEFNQMFPDAPGFARVPVSEDDIQPVLDQVRRYSVSVRRMADLYLTNDLPIAFVAGDDPSGVFAFAHYLLSIGEEIRVCFGSHEERSNALALIENNNQCGAVVDAFTAMHAAALDILPILIERLGPLAIPSSEFRRLMNMRAEQEALIGEETMTLGYQDEQYVRHIVSPEEHLANLNLLKSRIKAIENACIIESTVIPDDLTELGEALVGSPASDAVAPGVLASNNRLLLSEDMMLRRLSSDAFNTKGVWLQAVLMSAVQAGTLNQDIYSDAIVHLASHRHGSVSVSAIDLLSIFRRDNTGKLEQLDAVYHFLGNKNAEILSHVNTSAQFLNTILNVSVWHNPKEKRAAHTLFRTLFCRFRGKDWALWAASLYVRLHEFPRACLIHWCQGHFLRVEEVQKALQQLSSGAEDGQ